MRRIALIIFPLLVLALPVLLSGQSTITFQKTYGLTGYNYGRCTFQTEDGGYMILGNKSGFVGNTDIYLIKTDSMGEIEWDKAIGGTEIEWGSDFKITHDKGLIIAGYSNLNPENGYDVLLVKTDSAGNIEWLKNFGGKDWDLGYSVIEDKNHNFIVAGTTYSNTLGDADIYLLKVNSVGDTIWTKRFGGLGSDVAYSVDTTNFSDYLVSGITKKITDSTYDACLLKIKNNGNLLLSKIFGDTLEDKFYCARQYDDTTYILCGTTQNFGALNYDQWFMKTDTLGYPYWERIFTNAGNEELFDIKRNLTHEMVTTGYTTTWGAGMSDVTSTVFTDGGWFDFGSNFGGEKNDIAYTVNLAKDSGYVCTGTSESYGMGISNIYLIKTDKNMTAPLTTVHEVGIHDQTTVASSICSIYPNPTSGTFELTLSDVLNKNITFRIFNLFGEVLQSEDHASSTALLKKSFSLQAYPEGIYFVQISNLNITSTLKIIKLDNN